MKPLILLALLAATVSPARAEDAFQKAADEVMASVNGVWDKLMWVGYEDAQWTAFEAPLTTPCGTAQPSNVPFYCPEDKRIYLGLGFFSQVAAQIPDQDVALFVMSTVVAHEVGHHVQYLIGRGDGIDAARTALETDGKSKPSLFLSQRFELQADCYSGIWAHTAFQSMTPVQIKKAHEFTSILAHSFDNDPNHVATHGDGDQRMHWFDTGSKGGAPTSCDTFKSVSP